MNSPFKKILVFFLFLAILLGMAGFFYFNFVHNKPKIKIIEPKTSFDPIEEDSLLRTQTPLNKGD